MLRSFADKDTERVWRRERSRQLDQNTQRAALHKLLILDAAETQHKPVFLVRINSSTQEFAGHDALDYQRKQ